MISSFVDFKIKEKKTRNIITYIFREINLRTFKNSDSILGIER